MSDDTDDTDDELVHRQTIQALVITTYSGMFLGFAWVIAYDTIWSVSISRPWVFVGVCVGLFLVVGRLAFYSLPDARTVAIQLEERDLYD